MEESWRTWTTATPKSTLLAACREPQGLPGLQHQETEVLSTLHPSSNTQTHSYILKKKKSQTYIEHFTQKKLSFPSSTSKIHTLEVKGAPICCRLTRATCAQQLTLIKAAPNHSIPLHPLTPAPCFTLMLIDVKHYQCLLDFCYEQRSSEAG